MFATRCPFCTHGNPYGARFCNECGSPLHLAPCPHCNAVNDVEACTCYRCGAARAGEREVEVVGAATAPDDGTALRTLASRDDFADDWLDVLRQPRRSSGAPPRAVVQAPAAPVFDDEPTYSSANGLQTVKWVRHLEPRRRRIRTAAAIAIAVLLAAGAAAYVATREGGDLQRLFAEPPTAAVPTPAPASASPPTIEAPGEYAADKPVIESPQKPVAPAKPTSTGEPAPSPSVPADTSIPPTETPSDAVPIPSTPADGSAAPSSQPTNARVPRGDVGPSSRSARRPPAPPSTRIDKDALETERVIARELGKAAPPPTR